MDIRYLSRRTHEFAAQSSKASQTQRAAAPEEAAAEAATAATDGAAQQPAATGHVSRAGRLMNALQSFEERHPEQTKQILSNIADKLRSDAQKAGPWGGRLEKWADRFQQAADTGDMSKLVPQGKASGHFGMRAYQQVQQAAEPEPEEVVEHVADTAVTQASGLQGAVGVAAVADEAEKLKAVDMGEAPKTTTEGAKGSSSAGSLRMNPQTPPTVDPQASVR
jgi:hypothetical protein